MYDFLSEPARHRSFQAKFASADAATEFAQLIDSVSMPRHFYVIVLVLLVTSM